MGHEAISVFDMFKIGVGPSSSHTLGPWRAAQRFTQSLVKQGLLQEVVHVHVLLYGSLAKTGKGHGTDVAVQLGLSGQDPVTFEVDHIHTSIADIAQQQQLMLHGEQWVAFNPATDITFLFGETLAFHPNGLSFMVTLKNGDSIAETFYSVGGGFVVKEGEEGSGAGDVQLPFLINTANELLHWCRKTGMSVSEVVMENENAWRSEAETRNGVLNIWRVMRECIYRGCHTQGLLPGGLGVRRRGFDLNKKLIAGRQYQDYDSWVATIRQGGNGFKYTLDWLSCFALSVNEENASFGRVVTAPTNGAAGVIPAVLQYYVSFCDGNTADKIIQFLLCASELGSIFKKGATISAAMGGCQAEIGVSSAMAAAALTECMGGTQQQTLWDTALDMSSKYKETADGGLAVNIPISLSEC